MLSVPQACEGWANAMAAYRFSENDTVDWRAIPGAHTDFAMTRMAGHDDPDPEFPLNVLLLMQTF